MEFYIDRRDSREIASDLKVCLVRIRLRLDGLPRMLMEAVVWICKMLAPGAPERKGGPRSK